MTRNGATVWLTGLPSAGKSTLAGALAGRLAQAGRPAEILDGDEMRRALCSDLGFSKEDRNTNVRRIGFVARLLASNGVLVLVPVIAPYASSREAVARLHDDNDTTYLEVHIATTLDVCADRDVKGLYAKQAAGQISNLTGVDDPYEIPVSPHLAIDTSTMTVDQSVDQLYALLESNGLI
ncbi:MAG TPA: adenylyl-sulfate kinase [Actinocrinis sp.]|jgi:adenylylsulfate kinase